MSDNNSTADALTKKAISRIKKLTKGNGLKKNGITLIKSNAETITCDAITHIEISHSIKQETKKGQHQIGEFLENPQALDSMVESNNKDALKNKQMRKALTDMLLKRPDKGFSLHNEHFDVPALTREYCLPKLSRSGAKCLSGLWRTKNGAMQPMSWPYNDKL